MPQLEFTGVAVITALESGIGLSDTSLTLKDGSGWPEGTIGPFTATLGDPLAGDSLEKILVTGGRTGKVLNGVTRGYDGSTAQAWGPNTRIRHTITALWAAEVSAHVHNTTRHDHTQYLRSTDHAAIAHDESMLGPDSVGNSELKDDAVNTANILNLAVTNGKIANTTIEVGKLALAVAQALIPIGAILPYGGAVAPDGFLICDGDAVSRTTFSALFGVISTAFGAGDGSLTFNLPDYRQRFPLGKADSGTGNVLGAVGGLIDHVHALNSASSGVEMTINNNLLEINRKALASWDATLKATAVQSSGTANRTDGATLQGDTATANPPFQVCNYIIKT